MADDNEVLFTITRDNLNKGLRGIPVGTCRTSRVDPLEGVSYVGYSVKELADLDPESVVYLMFHKDLPNDEQLAAFKADLAARAGLSDTVIKALLALPDEGHPMEWLISGLVMVGMVSKTGDWMEDALNLVAKAPQLIATIFRVKNGWGDPIAPAEGKGLIENFVHMMGVPDVDHEALTRLLRTFYILHMDHGGGNLSTFSGKCVASGHADIFASMAGAMAGLYGPLHGRANQSALNFVKTVPSSEPAEVEQFVRDTLASGGLIFGFGHAVLRAEDPRATIQYALGKELCPDDEYFKIALQLRESAVKVLKENPKIANPYPNVDAVSGTLLNAHGLTDTNFYTLLFGLARISGIAAQIVDERLVLRDGKGVPIYRCKFLAENQEPRSLS